MKDKILEILRKNQTITYDNFSNKSYSITPGSYEKIALQINESIDKTVLDDKAAISSLEAKVYVYEKVIANSNFKTIIEEKESKGEQ